MVLAGVEEKRIFFFKGGNSQHVHEKIEAFPTLETAGGYEIPRTGERGNRQLMVLSIPPGGYTVLYLKATTASAKRYKRPLQKNQVSTHLYQNRSKCRWVFFFLLPNSAMISIPFAGPRVLNKLWWSFLKTTNSCLYQWKGIIKMNEWINKINKPMNEWTNEGINTT